MAEYMVEYMVETNIWSREIPLGGVESADAGGVALPSIVGAQLICPLIPLHLHTDHKPHTDPEILFFTD